MSRTEFCCRLNGSNLNAGTRTGSSTIPGTSADLTYAGGTFVRSTVTFTVASGNPVNDGVVDGDVISVYTTAGATVATCLIRVTSRTTNSITGTVIAGAETNVSESAGAATCKVGGAWAGPSGSTIFPFNFAAATMTNAAGDFPRVNLKNDQTYSISAALNHTLVGPVTFQGFGTAYGDAANLHTKTNKALIDAGTNNIVPVTLAGADCELLDFEITGGGSGANTNSGVVITGIRCRVARNVIHGVMKHGVHANGSQGTVAENEIYDFANTSTGGACAGVYVSAAPCCVARNKIHDCLTDHGSHENDGIWIETSSVWCIANIISKMYSRGILKEGGAGTIWLFNNSINVCDHGIEVNTSGVTVYGDSNAIFNCSQDALALGSSRGYVTNTAYGSNGGSNLQDGSTPQAENSILFPAGVTPWADPDNGDFTVNHLLAQGTGRNLFTQTNGSGVTESYRDVGAAQSRISLQAEALLTADKYIDTSTTPWEEVWIVPGTGGIGVGTELLRRQLFGITGEDITSVSFVGSAVQE